MENEISKILNELKEIRIDINFLKNHIVDPDCIFTAEEKEEYEQSLEDYRQGKTISLEELEKEINSNKKK